MDRRNFLKTSIVGLLGITLSCQKIFDDRRANTYLDEFNLLPDSYKQFDKNVQDGLEETMGSDYLNRRKELVSKYSWAVPNDLALSSIADFVGLDDIVDFGSGSGYWAYMLKNFGINTFCIDNWSLPKPDRLYHQVLTGSFEKLSAKRTSALMMVWPMRMTGMATTALKEWGGNRLVYVGEPLTDGYARSTAEYSFFYELNKNYNEAGKVDIPNWYNHNDSVFLYEKKV